MCHELHIPSFCVIIIYRIRIVKFPLFWLGPSRITSGFTNDQDQDYHHYDDGGDDEDDNDDDDDDDNDDVMMKTMTMTTTTT